MYVEHLTLIREFLGPSTSAISGKKSTNIACDATVGTKKIKLYVQIEYQLGFILWYLLQMAYANMRGNMPRWRTHPADDDFVNIARKIVTAILLTLSNPFIQLWLNYITFYSQQENSYKKLFCIAGKIVRNNDRVKV